MMLDSARSGAHKFMNSRRTVLALFAMGCCLAIAIRNHVDTSNAIAFIVTSIAGANAAQTVMTNRVGTNTSPNQSTTPNSEV